MAYQVNKTDGTLLTTIFDGQNDSYASPTGSSSITLIGKQVTNYGELQNENFIRIMENFSNESDPPFPIQGQLWWNNSSKTLNIFDGTDWRPATGFLSSASTPTTPYIGDQWYDSTNQQYKVYNGTSWILIGPSYSALDGITGAMVDHFYDSVTFAKHPVVKLYTTGNVVAIISNVATFTPNVSVAGFTSINPGITFSTSLDAVKLYGTATNADSLGNISASQYLRNDINGTIVGSLTVQDGVNVGVAGEGTLSSTTGNIVLTNTNSNKNVILSANVAGVITNALVVNGTTGLVTVASNPSGALGIATKGYVDTADQTLNTNLTNALVSNVNTLVGFITANTSTLQSSINAANVQISLRAPINSPVFTGIPQSVTPSVGDYSANIATTRFIGDAISSFDTSKIYSSLSSVQVSDTDLVVNINGSNMMTISATLGATVTTPSANDNSTKIATTAYVDNATKNYVLNSVSYKPTCYVSSNAPDNGTGVDGDMWFRYQG